MNGKALKKIFTKQIIESWRNELFINVEKKLDILSVARKKN